MSNSDLEREHRVTPLELFFDLVFVFAITQVTAFMAADPTWGGVLRGMLLLAALWWAWTAYAWLTNTINPEEGAIRLAVFASMAAMLVVALSVPEAFDDHGVLFGVAYLFVRVLHLALYAIAGRGDKDLLGAVLRLAITATLGPALIIAAGFLEGDQRVAFWLTALALDYVGPALFGRGRGWRVSPHHFAERHALIIIIAFGESIVALGVGASGLHLDEGAVMAAILGVVIVAALWWLYFDTFAILAGQLFAERTGIERARLARDAYSYLHLPMVAGIVLFALALKKTLGDVGEPLGTVSAFALCGGLALYLLAQIAFILRHVRRVFRMRLATALVLLALLPAATELPPVASLALVALVCCTLVGYEVLRYREHRSRLRHPQPA